MSYESAQALSASGRLLAKRDGEIATLREQVKLLREAMDGLLSVYVECVTPTCNFSEAATAEYAARTALAATEPKETT